MVDFEKLRLKRLLEKSLEKAKSEKTPMPGPSDKRLTVADLSPDQRVVHDAVLGWVGGLDRRMANSENLFTLGGFAGTGKTSVLGVLARTFEDQGLLVAYVTVTGRASSILARKLKAAGATVTSDQRPSGEQEGKGFDSSLPLRSGPAFCGTFHRLVYMPMINDQEEVIGWRKRKELDRQYDLVVIDECFHPDQQVWTERGWLKIGAIVNQKLRVRVWARDSKTGLLELKPIVRWLKKPAPDALLKIQAGRTGSMRSARQLVCTPSHKVLTPTGYVKAGALRVGDELVVRGREMTPLQFSLLVGSMLGDGSMNRHEKRNSPQPKLTQGEAQLDWLKFKQALFGDLAGPLRKGRSGYGDKDVWSFTIAVTDQARRIAEQMPFEGHHPGGRRRWTPTDRFLAWLTPLALAVWYLDDGSLSYTRGRPRANLHTEGFDEKDQRRFVEVLRARFGLCAKVRANGRGHYLLVFGVKETLKLLDLVAPFTPTCMAQKAPGRRCVYRPKPQKAAELTVAPVRLISDMPLARVPYVYDLEVADHHNYIAGNVVVSNCSMVSYDMLAELQTFDRPVLAVGDHGQLPPVASSGSIVENPRARLETIHRQAEGNPIIALSKVVREKGLLLDRCADGDRVRFVDKSDLGDWLARAHGNGKGAASELASLRVGMVCYTNRIRVWLNTKMRRACGFSGKPRQGEPVLCLKNYPPIFNGMRGRLTADVEEGEEPWLVSASAEFLEEGLPAESFQLCAPQFNREKTYDKVEDLRERGVDIRQMSDAGMLFDFGYALTCHKSQGSEFDTALVYLDREERPRDDDWRRWCYTAVTRAKERLVVFR